MSKRSGLWVVVGALLVIVGCDDHIFPSGAESEYTEDLAGVELLFEQHCEACHPSLNAFDLSVMEADIQNNTGTYVVPFDASSSQFWQRLVGEGGYNIKLGPISPLIQSVAAHVRALKNTHSGPLFQEN